MMRFIDHVNEVLGSHHPYEHEDVGAAAGYDARHEYKFNAGTAEDPRHFRVNIGHKEGKAHVLFVNHEMDSTMTGQHPRDAHKVIGTVGHIVKQHMAAHKDISHVKFSADADDKGRVKLYDRMAAGFGHRAEVVKTPFEHHYTVRVR
jgi:hypothetical protein